MMMMMDDQSALWNKFPTTQRLPPTDGGSVADLRSGKERNVMDLAAERQ